MSAIHTKSLTGITSITTPSGVDNVFTVHSNDTTERFRVDLNGNQSIAGILTVSQDLDVDGHTNLDNVSVAGVTTFSSNINLGDSDKILIGASQDLQFYHDFSGGSENSHIKQTTSKHLQITAYTTFNRVSGTWGVIKDSNSHNIIRATAGSDVKLYYNNGEKLATAGHGINITGGFVATGIVTASAFKLSDGSNVGGVESDAQFNTVSGTNAGDSFSGTNAQRNTLIGYNAGTNISSADDNTAVGHNALLSQTTGNRNVALGSNVMDASTTAANNVAIGYNAMTKATNNSCNKNVAIGYEAATELTTGQRNVLIGHYAGYDLQSGSFNTCVGDFAGANLSNSSNDNTCIGQNAGFSLNGSNNILIGHDATESTYTISNEITLGDSNISHLRVPGIGVSFGRSGATIAGVVTATSFSGDGSNLTGISGVTINNNADNRVITGSGTANTLEGESTLTYDGTNLDLGDGKYVRLGASNDFQMWHNGGTGNTNIKQVSGHIYFYTGSDLNMLLQDGTSVDLYYANSKEFQTTSYGISIGNDAAGSISGQAGIEIGKGHTTSELRLKNSSGGSGSGDGFGIQKWSDGNTYIYEYDPHNFVIGTNGTSRWIIGGTSGHITPFANNTYDIGSTSARVRNIYTNDLNLSNEGSSNDVDGTWGNYTIQEGEDDLFLINKRNGKKYKFNLTEVS